MLSVEALSILRCPENRSPLAPADDALLRDINAAVDRGALCNRAGKRVERRVEAGLVREDNRVMYPILDEIPVLIRDEGIELEQLRQ
jgi:uncharacterized protein YbaR (Trm112 family)